MAKFRKRPVVVEAVRVPVERTPEERDMEAWGVLAATLGLWMREMPWSITEDLGVNIPTMEGMMRASPGDYIIKGVAGECYPCKPAIFAATYEAVES